MAQEKNYQETDVINTEPFVGSLGGNGGGGGKDGGDETGGGGGEGLAHIGSVDGGEGSLDSEGSLGWNEGGSRRADSKERNDRLHRLESNNISGFEIIVR